MIKKFTPFFNAWKEKQRTNVKKNYLCRGTFDGNRIKSDSILEVLWNKVHVNVLCALRLNVHACQASRLHYDVYVHCTFFVFKFFFRDRPWFFSCQQVTYQISKSKKDKRVTNKQNKRNHIWAHFTQSFLFCFSWFVCILYSLYIISKKLRVVCSHERQEHMLIE